VRRDEFEDFLRRVPQALVVLDEAYADFVTDPDAASGDDLLGRFENLAVLRTFSKAYSLAGLRVGYLVGQPAVARAVRRFAAPFSVNALAQAAAVAALGERETVARRASRVTMERDRVQAALRDAGVDVPGGQGNFLWLPLAEHTMAVSEELERRGVVARPFPPHGLRVTVSMPAHNDFFVDRLTEVLRERPALFTPAD
jgi:histidinol-phosphate aminotransferase